MFLAYLQLLLPRQRKGHTIMSVPNVLIKKMYWGLVLQLPHTLGIIHVAPLFFTSSYHFLIFHWVILPMFGDENFVLGASLFVSSCQRHHDNERGPKRTKTFLQKF